MNEIWISRYELRPLTVLSARAAKAPRAGALLRVGHGFADLHPWPELGDKPLDEQLTLLASGTTTPSTRASLLLAEADGEARAIGKSLFHGLTIPVSHYLRLSSEGEIDIEELARQGFERIKVKAGKDLDSERVWITKVLSKIEATHATLKMRIDFNAAVTRFQLESFLAFIPQGLRGHIDFLEDPLPYDPDTWQELRDVYGVRLAADFEKPSETFRGIDTLVIKPARENVAAQMEMAAAHDLRVVVTSSLDHPVGLMGAAFAAAGLQRDRPDLLDACGLLSHTSYQRDAFSERIAMDGPHLNPPSGTGIGFDDLLAALPWERLK